MKSSLRVEDWNGPTTPKRKRQNTGRRRCKYCNNIRRGKAQLEMFDQWDPFCSRYHKELWEAKDMAERRKVAEKRREGYSGPEKRERHDVIQLKPE